MPLLDHIHPPLSLRRHWHSFHNAWATYLSADINRRLPAVVDVVTDRRVNLHAALMARINAPQATAEPDLYAASYRRIERDGERELDVWLEPLAIGSVLPSVPLGLPGPMSVRVELESTYERTLIEQRVPLNGV